MKFLIALVFTFLLVGCAVSPVNYNGVVKIDKVDTQYYENKECSYLVGPFNANREIIIEEAITKTIAKANEEGLYGDSLVNIEIQNGGYTTFIFSELCLYIQGNIINSKQ